MKTCIIALIFLVTLTIVEIHGDPLMFFPQHMLPPIGTTFTFTFNGMFNTLNVSGVYAIQTVVDEDTKTVIGYRNWQSYTGEYTGIFYGVSYNNRSYSQALIDPNTHECNNAFVEVMNCTSWSNTGIINWSNRCSLVRVDSPISGTMSLTLTVSKLDLTRPVTTTAIATIDGSPDEAKLFYQYLTKSDQEKFPYIKCSF